jgi:hypothetical protein
MFADDESQSASTEPLGVLATETKLATLEAENFQLKLRIYFLEQRLDPKQASLIVSFFLFIINSIGSIIHVAR